MTLRSAQRVTKLGSQERWRQKPDTSWTVPDPVAEARQAARLAAESPENTLVLVHHDSTAARVHRALLRNGVPSAWRGSARLERHTLASVIRRCVPWFGGRQDPNVRAVDLHEVLRHPLLAQRLPPPAETWLCLEVSVDQGGGTLEADMYLDGDPLDYLVHSQPQTTVLGNFEARYLKVGMQSYSGEFDGLLIDDLSVSSTRVGCG